MSGVDALYLSGGASLPSGLFEVLEERRAEAEAARASVPLVVAGEEFGVAPRSMGMYRFMLEHRHGVIGVSPRSKIPPLRVQPRSEFLHAVGPATVLAFFDRIGEYLAAGPVVWGLNRIDLFCDVQGWHLTGNDRDRFVSRAEDTNTYEKSRVFTGHNLGRRTSKTVLARIYDKTVQVAKERLDWWPEVWGHEFDPFEPVIRVELEINRRALKEFGIKTPQDGLDQAGGMWAGLTTDWVSYRLRTADQTRSRWPVAPEWKVIQNAALRGNAIGLKRVRAGRHKGDLRSVLPGAIGYLASVAAIEGTTDTASTLRRMAELIAQDEKDRGVVFEGRIEDRNRDRRYR